MFHPPTADRLTAMSRVRAVLLLFLVLVALRSYGCRPSQPDSAVTTVRIYDLLSTYPRAEKKVKDRAYISNDEFSVDGEVRPGLFLHASGSVTFPPVRLSPESVLTFKVGVMDGAWDKPGDGVEFMAFAQRLNDAPTKLFSRYLDPKHEPRDRRWFEARIPLRVFGNQEIRIVFATAPGPAGDFQYDWGVWAEPQIILSEQTSSE